MNGHRTPENGHHDSEEEIDDGIKIEYTPQVLRQVDMMLLRQNTEYEYINSLPPIQAEEEVADDHPAPPGYTRLGADDAPLESLDDEEDDDFTTSSDFFS
jgi:hypothetical protein